MKKVAVIKLGSRITFGGSSGGSGEALAIIEMLYKGGFEVEAYTKVLKKDYPIHNIDTHNILDTYKDVSADALIVINGNVNYFGGQDSPEQTVNYHIINNFKGPVYYILCDPNLSLAQCWPSIEKKPWASNYNKEDILITRKDIKYITQAENCAKVLAALKSDIEVKTAKHYPMEQFPLLYPRTFNVPLSSKKYDLLYGGTFRSGKRQEDMIKYYFGLDGFNVTMFGNIKESDFSVKKVGGLSHPNYEGPVKYDDFNSKMSNAVATVIIGDKYYKEISDLAQRIYESISAGIVTFIDADYDRSKRVYKNPKLQFLYVNSKEDLKSKLDKIKKLTDEQYQQLIDLQREDVKIDSDKYCTSFVDLIKGM